MKRTFVALALALFALPLSAAIQYEFFQKTTSDGDNAPPADLSARATVDNGRTRVDVISGNVYPPGSYVISSEGGRRMLFVDPTMKTFTEVNTTSFVSGIGASNIQIENLKSDLQTIGASDIIAGHPTTQYRLTLSYDITVIYRNMPLKQSVRTVIDKWTTVAFGELVEDAVSNASLRTGNLEVDKVIDLEATRIKGFPLRQNVTVTTISHRKRSVSGSDLKFPTTRIRQKEMWVTAIRSTATNNETFTVPAGFKKMDVQQLPKGATEIVTLTPGK
ncbi:MAG TPA: hypothetical protein VF618_08185 [Thermoanaerobaculia bacterium]